MAVTYIDPGAGALAQALSNLGSGIVQNVNADKIRESRFRDNPQLLMALRGPAQAAKRAGKLPEFAQSLGLPPEMLEQLSNLTATEELGARSAEALLAADGPEAQAAVVMSGARRQLGEDAAALALLPASVRVQAQQLGIQENALGEYASIMSRQSPRMQDIGTMFQVDPAFAQALFAGDMQALRASLSATASGPSLEDRLKLFYDYTEETRKIQDRFEAAEGDEEQELIAREIRNNQIMGALLQDSGMLPPGVELVGVREGRKWLGLARELELYGVGLESVDDLSVALSRVEEGEATPEELISSAYFQSLPEDLQSKVAAYSLIVTEGPGSLVAATQGSRPDASEEVRKRWLGLFQNLNPANLLTSVMNLANPGQMSAEEAQAMLAELREARRESQNE